MPWSKKREDHDVETGGPAPSRSSSCSSSSTVKPSSLARQLDKETNIVLTMKSIERGLQIITICISILYCATLALSSRQQQQQLGSKQEQQVPPMSNIAPFSTMRRFKKPPTLKQMYKSRNCESYFTQITADGKRIDSTSLPIYTKKEWEYFRKVWRDQGGQDPSKLYKLNSRRRSMAPPDFFRHSRQDKRKMERDVGCSPHVILRRVNLRTEVQRITFFSIPDMITDASWMH